ncbi:LOW QUALITY PROTEIN: F-box protein At3g59000 [Eutrema salsugineum]|uniref:LOW QUALITY PROTEIN: F-box protein At3g59000 n=1 Tax=Eutrema salsugineum TaxID=72664 RepID=UPI000CED4272|nr:LOW QUALITY PROTEIN: F-box protein At3g59000 [Eutrema salsugineum]
MDRMSSLPDELLCHILSFLTTKEAALTSILAKRWRNLLALVPYLDIDDSVFLHPEEGKRDRTEIIQSFMDFVDRVMAIQGDSPIKKFSLKCLTEVDSDRVDGWISNVLARGVSDLDLLVILDTDIDDNYRLSPKCFESSTLAKLKIGCGIHIGWLSESIFLPMLKTLVLDSVGFYVNKFESLLHALHLLEELVLVDILWQDWDVNVSSASLKTLTIKNGGCLDTLSFDTPSLVYFKYSGYVAPDFPVVNMKNLFDAQIIFFLTEEQLERAREPDNGDWFDDDVVLGYSNVWKLFHGIRNVPNLYLSPETLEVLSLCCESMPVFNNLKSLAIMSDKERGWQAMPVLLRNCPHLETLVIEGLVHHVTDKCGDACDCITREDKGRSLTSCPVKVLEIRGFSGTMKEMAMIKHFLDYFPSLKEMEIYVEEDGPTQLKNPEVSKHVLEMFEL